MILNTGISHKIADTLEVVQNQYAELISSKTSISLLSLFDSEHFDYSLFCKDYTPHPQTGDLKKISASFGEQYEILLPDFDAYITCALFLFPAAPIDKLIPISKNYVVDFYLNDKMGRDAKPSNPEMKTLYEIRDKLAINQKLSLDNNSSQAEIANINTLKEICDDSPKEWFEEFRITYLRHIQVAHQPYDLTTLGYIQSVEEYIGMRADISGMPHSVALIQYALSAYLDWKMLETAQIDKQIRKINETVSYIGALMNDLFSFEKEVIDNGSDSNLVFLVIVNNFRMHLKEGLQVAGHIIRTFLEDYKTTIDCIDRKLENSSLPESSKRNVQQYLAGLKTVLQACWTWQCFTQRYKRDGSIWTETSA